MSIGEANQWVASLQLDKSKKVIAERVLKEIRERLGFLVSVGLNYLSLDRHAGSLSGGVMPTQKKNAATPARMAMTAAGDSNMPVC